MILLPCSDFYHNTQVYFRQHIVDQLPNDPHVWAQAYRDWLALQGCEIILSNDRASTLKLPLRKSLGVAPFYDSFGFRNDHDATVFALRWA